MDVTERMRDIMLNKKLSQIELARRAKSKQQTVNGWLRAKDVSTRVVRKFCEAAGITVEEFYLTPEYVEKHFKLSQEAYSIAQSIDNLPLERKEDAIDLIKRQLNLYVQAISK